MFLVDGDGWS